MAPLISAKYSNERILLSWLTERSHLNGGGWGLVASPVFKTGVTRPSRVGWVRFPHSPATLALFALAVAAASPAEAQQKDTTLSKPFTTAVLCKKPSGETGPVPAVPKVVISGEYQPPVPECRVPISPRAALVRSILVPGWGEYSLDRRKSAALFATIELSSYAMVIKSKHDLDLAKAARRDTTIETLKDAQGNPIIDPTTGLPKTFGKPKNQNLADRLRARRTHLEDWIAGIVFNHLFSGADAWVAAQLADFDTNVNVTAVGRGVQVAARIAW